MATISYPQQEGTSVFSTDNAVLLNLDTMPENGFITQISLVASAFSGTVAPKFCIYDDNALVFTSASQSWDTTLQSRSVSVAGVGVASGSALRWGIWRPAGTSNVSYDQDFNQSGHDYAARSGQSTGPYSTYSASSLLSTISNRAVTGTLTYTPNAAPTQGTWMAPAAGGGAGLTPTFQGTIPQDASDAALDTITDVELKVTRTSDSVVVYDTILVVTATERTNGYFSKAPVTLAAGTEYRATYRHRDSFGVWSPWALDRTFNTSPAPNATALTPSGKINTVSAFVHTATHTHQNSLNVDQVEIELWNATATTRLYTSGAYVLPASVAPGATISVNENVLTANGGYPDLAWSTSYQWRIKARDTATVWGSFSAFQTFNTNAPPNAPTNLTPANNQVTPLRDFSATVTDPDGDAITAAQIELVDVTSGNIVVAGYPKSMTVSGSTISFSAPSGDMVLGRQYKWRARADDGNPSGYGAYSDYAFMTYQNVPIVALAGPLAARKNLIEEPSAEYAPGTFWTETARSAGVDEINRVNDTDVAYGAWAWRAIAAGDNRLRMTNYKTVDATKAYAFFIWAKKESGTSATHFNVLCYDNANTLLGTLQPNSEGALSGTNLTSTWVRYGGVVYHTASSETVKFPAGTTKVKVEITPSRSSAATVRFDAVGMTQLYAMSATEWADARKWLGYADGDSTGYGLDLYTWSGTVGSSESNTLAWLTQVPASVVINYTHLSALAKTNDRLIIEKWGGSAYTQIYDSNPTWATSNGARTVIPIPTGYIKNEGRYRLKVQARDTVPTTGDSPWAEFDVLYIGPAQLTLRYVTSDPVKAQISVGFDPTALVGVAFGGIELRVTDETTGETWIEDFTTDPASTELVFHSPISAHDYLVQVRQIENVSGEEVEGRWNGGVGSVDYWPYFFVKDADKPGELYAAYETEAGSLGATSEETPSAIFAPWGAEDEIVLTRRRIKGGSGQVSAQFFPEALNQEDEETRYENMKAILERRRTIILLQQAPDQEVVHAAVIGEHAKGFIPPRTKTLSFSWRKVGYERDYYARQGVT